MINRIKNPFKITPYSKGNKVPAPMRDKRGFNREGLTEKQKLFVKYYVETLSPKIAAEKAGYSTDGSYLLSKPKIQRAISQERARVEKIAASKYQVDADKVLKELFLIAFQDMGSYFDDWGYNPQLGRNVVKLKNKAGLSSEQTRIISEVSEEIKGKNGRSFKFKTAEKLQALKLLGQYLGLFDTGRLQESPEDVAKAMREATAAAVQTLPGGKV